MFCVFIVICIEVFFNFLFDLIFWPTGFLVAYYLISMWLHSSLFFFPEERLFVTKQVYLRKNNAYKG